MNDNKTAADAIFDKLLNASAPVSQNILNMIEGTNSDPVNALGCLGACIALSKNSGQISLPGLVHTVVEMWGRQNAEFEIVEEKVN